MSAVATAASVAPQPTTSRRGADSLGGDSLKKAPQTEEVAAASQLSVKKANKGQRTTTRRRKRAQLEPGQTAPQERAQSAQPAVSHKSSSSGASGCHQLAAKPASKTTRVRINSTSEQIEDPNWLQHRIQLEQQQQQQQKLSAHLRQLQHKFKMTITGQHSSDEASLRPESAPLPPSLPMMPAKAPVSILKQRSRSPAPAAELPRQVEAAGNPGGSTGGGTRHRSTAHVQHPPAPKSNPPVSQPKPAGGLSAANNPHTTTTTTTTAHIMSAGANITPTTPSQASTCAGQEPAKIVPLCAEGQLKVSGWKRKNLLAKTLGHLDEIRGNQMPVFVPTKIRLPSNSANSNSHSSGSKFVDVVRQAMATKRTSSTPAGALTSGPTCHIPSQLSGTNQISSSSILTPDDVPTPTTKRASVTELRANSADHSHHQQLHHQSARHQPVNQQQQQLQQRSSSAGLNQQSGSLVTSPKQQVTPTASAQPTTIRTSRPQHLVVENSARLYKLAHKNQQLLHNLRRQSNEHQPSAVASLITASRTGNVAPEDRPTAHLKEWKRLASKLALLTTGGRATAKGSSEANQLLRVSVSNDEAGSASASSTNQRQLSDKSLLLAVPSGTDSSGPRKLSSSSMFAQGNPSEAAPSQRLSSDLSGGQAKQPTPTTTTTQREVPRRSSDSEAYKRSSIREYLRPEAPEATPDSQVNDEVAEELPRPEQEQPVVVVRGDDLLQLLQVASTCSDANLGGITRRSLQLEERPQIINTETKRKNSTHSMEGLVFDEKQTCDAVQEQRAPLVALTDTNSADQACQQPARRARRDQLGSLVKKTTKVVFLQEKLRKIRWRQSNRGTSSTTNTVSLGLSDLKANEEPRAKVVEIATSDSTEDGLKTGQQTNHGSKGDPAEVLMDPTLIGDAIEIFLRSSMQNRRTTDKEDEADAPLRTSVGQ